MKERKEILPAFLIAAVIGSVVAVSMMYVQPYLIKNHHFILSFGEIAQKTADGSWGGWLQWYLAEIGEPVVSRTIPTGIGMFVFAMIGLKFEKKNSRWRGSDIAGGSGLFLPIFFMSMLSLFLCDLLFAGDAQYGFVPTFISVCTILPFTVPIYGYKGINAITQIVLAGILPYALARPIMFYITEPLGLSRAVAGFCGIFLATLIVEEMLPYLPWMKQKDLKKYRTVPKKIVYGPRHFIERVLADPNEMSCWGSSWSTIGMYVGGISAWVLNPNASSNIEGFFPIIMCSQFFTVLLSNFLYYPYYQKGCPKVTFSGYVVISSLINTFAMTGVTLVLMIILAAVLTPLVSTFFVTHIHRWKFVSVPVLMGIILVTCILTYVEKAFLYFL